MLSESRPARPNGRPTISFAVRLAALALLAGLAACGGGQPLPEPAPAPVVEEPPPPEPAVVKPPSSFSLVVDEAVRRKRVIERLKQILLESEP